MQRKNNRKVATSRKVAKRQGKGSGNLQERPGRCKFNPTQTSEHLSIFFLVEQNFGREKLTHKYNEKKVKEIMNGLKSLLNDIKWVRNKIELEYLAVKDNHKTFD